MTSNPHTLTINSDLIVPAVSCQHQVPLHLKRITDLRHIESLIDDIVNFEPNSEIFDSSLVIINIKVAATKLQSSVLILENIENQLSTVSITAAHPYYPSSSSLFVNLETRYFQKKGGDIT